jgi:hypothetical protein
VAFAEVLGALGGGRRREALGLREAALRLIQAREVHLAGQGLRTIRTEKTLADLERFAEERLRLIEATLSPFEEAELVHRASGFGVLVAQDPAAELERPLQVRLRSGMRAELTVRGAQRGAYRRFDEGFGREASAVLRGLVHARPRRRAPRAW